MSEVPLYTASQESLVKSGTQFIKLGFNSNYYSFALILLSTIVL